MNIDTKLPAFRSFMSETKLNNGGVKTTIDQSAVAAGEQANVDFNLNSEEGKKGNGKSKKKEKDKLDFLENKNPEVTEVKKNGTEVKTLNLKLLNLL